MGSKLMAAPHRRWVTDKNQNSPQPRPELARWFAFDIIQSEPPGGNALSRASSLSDARHWSFLFGLESLQQHLGVGGAEVARAMVPERGRTRVAAHTAQVDAIEKKRIECLPQPNRCNPASRVSSAFVEETC